MVSTSGSGNQKEVCLTVRHDRRSVDEDPKDTQSHVQILAGIERRIHVRVLETKSMREGQRVQVVGTHEGREIAYPEIKIGGDIRQPALHEPLLEEELPINRRIRIGLEIRQIPEVQTRGEVQVLKESTFESQPITGIYQRNVHGRIGRGELQMSIEVPVPVLREREILGAHLIAGLR
jgi:hypothetical protein